MAIGPQTVAPVLASSAYSWLPYELSGFAVATKTMPLAMSG